MRIAKAVVTAASRKQRTLPLQTLIDRDGLEKSVLAIIIEETLRAGIEEICVVVCPGDEKPYAEAAGAYASLLAFVHQAEPLGYGHAVYCAKDFCPSEPILHLVGDHLYVRQGGTGCAEELVRMAESQSCSISAVQPSHESLLPYYERPEVDVNPLLGERYGLDREQFAPVLTEFYALHGWDANGQPTKEGMDALGMGDLYKPMVQGAAAANSRQQEASGRPRQPTAW